MYVNPGLKKLGKDAFGSSKNMAINTLSKNMIKVLTYCCQVALLVLKYIDAVLTKTVLRVRGGLEWGGGDTALKLIVPFYSIK